MRRAPAIHDVNRAVKHLNLTSGSLEPTYSPSRRPAQKTKGVVMRKR